MYVLTVWYVRVLTRDKCINAGMLVLLSLKPCSVNWLSAQR